MCDVLLLDDDALVLVTLAESLRDAGFEVGQARSAGEAADWLESETPPQLLVADLDLGGGEDGRKVARSARDLQPDLPIIFISGLPDNQHLVAADEVFIAKPFLPARLVAAIRAKVTPRAAPPLVEPA